MMLRITIAAMVLVLCVAGCLEPIEAGKRSEVVTASLDTHLDEESPNDNNVEDATMLWVGGADGSESVPLIQFVVPSLAAGETLDSATVEVYVTSIHSVAPSTYHVYELDETDMSYLTCTWYHRKAVGYEWDEYGAWGSDDIDKTASWGYGANGHVFEGTSASSEEVTWDLCRGSYFSDFIDARQGETISIVVHGKGVAEDTGRMSMAAEDHESLTAPRLILYINTPLEASPKRRRSMQLF